MTGSARPPRPSASRSWAEASRTEVPLELRPPVRRSGVMGELPADLRIRIGEEGDETGQVSGQEADRAGLGRGEGLQAAEDLALLREGKVGEGRLELRPARREQLRGSVQERGDGDREGRARLEEEVDRVDERLRRAGRDSARRGRALPLRLRIGVRPGDDERDKPVDRVVDEVRLERGRARGVEPAGRKLHGEAREREPAGALEEPPARQLVHEPDYMLAAWATRCCAWTSSSGRRRAQATRRGGSSASRTR